MALIDDLEAVDMFYQMHADLDQNHKNKEYKEVIDRYIGSNKLFGDIVKSKSATLEDVLDQVQKKFTGDAADMSIMHSKDDRHNAFAELLGKLLAYDHEIKYVMTGNKEDVKKYAKEAVPAAAIGGSASVYGLFFVSTWWFPLAPVVGAGAGAGYFYSKWKKAKTELKDKRKDALTEWRKRAQYVDRIIKPLYW